MVAPDRPFLRSVSRASPALLAAAVAVGCAGTGLQDPRISASPDQIVGSHGAAAQLPATGPLTPLGPQETTAALDAQRQALDAPQGGVTISWQSGSAFGTVTPGPIHRVNDLACRDVVHVAQMDRERLSARSTLCRTGAGPWEPLAEGDNDRALTSDGPRS